MDDSVTHATLYEAKSIVIKEAELVFEKQLEELRECCKHEKWTNWLTGYQVESRLCKRCHKVMKSNILAWRM